MPKSAGLTEVANPSNDAAELIQFQEPIRVEFELTGAVPILFHRYSVESVEEKSQASKGSASKKTDDTESYLWRDREGYICLPGEYIHQSVIYTGKFHQDPRSPRKSMFDLLKAAVQPVTMLAPINGGVKDSDYMDRRRVTVQRNAITRSRPAFHEGWKATFLFDIALPEYVNTLKFHEILSQAGRVTGTADFRPTYGRFLVTRFTAL